MKQRRLGTNGPQIGAIGYGAMVLEGYYGGIDEEQAVETLRKALDLGSSIDTADAYGGGHNEGLVGRAIEGRADEAFVATKFGIVYDDREPSTDLATGWGFSLPVNGSAEYARRALDASLKNLGRSHVDLWYLHYPDPSLAIEETVAAMAEAVADGTVRHLGLSNVNAEQVRRANRVHPIAAVQYEYSLWRREAEDELLPTTRELGIALVPWSPLGAGFLTGAVGELADSDFRNNNPRFQGENMTANRERFSPLMAVAGDLGISPAQLALAWLLHQGDDIVPIPGTRSPDRVAENAAAADIELDGKIIDRISQMAAHGSARGETLL
jgi:aryl-alcohol dehydrogenase-like predicted oxidoreductase